MIVYIMLSNILLFLLSFIVVDKKDSNKEYYELLHNILLKLIIINGGFGMFKTENFFMKEAYTSKMGWQRFDILNHVIYESEDEVKFLERFMGQFEIYKITQNVRINIIFSNAVNMFAKMIFMIC